MPDSAKCARVTRHADYVSVDLAIGVPSRVLRLLLRLDRPADLVNSTFVRIHSSSIVESAAVSCSDATCTDVALISQRGPASPQKPMALQFTYANSNNEFLSGSTSQSMGLDGDLFLLPEHDHFLTSSHFCWVPIADTSEIPPGGLRASLVGGEFHTDANVSAADKPFRRAPAAVYREQCKNATGGSLYANDVALFPAKASGELGWLLLSNSDSYETSPDGVDARRRVIEVGRDCSSSLAEFAKPSSLLDLDCLSSYADCDLDPSIPFRRVADTELRIVVHDGSAATLFSKKDARLGSLPRLEQPASAIGFAILKVFLLLLAAAIVFIRSSRQSSSHSQLYLTCCVKAHCSEAANAGHCPDFRLGLFEDAFIGLVAIAARIGASVWRSELLAHDNQQRVATAEILACVLSLSMWFSRYFLVDSNESPLVLLGGSTALIDASSAVLLAFSEPPLLVSSMGRFDPTARLLTAILCSLVVLPRIIFATASCGVILNSGIHGISINKLRFEHGYCVVLGMGIFAWLAQVAAVAILLSDCFALPLSFSIARQMPGSFSTLQLAVFLGVTATSFPRLLRDAGVVAESSIEDMKSVSRGTESKTN